MLGWISEVQFPLLPFLYIPSFLPLSSSLPFLLSSSLSLYFLSSSLSLSPVHLPFKKKINIGLELFWRISYM